MIISRVGKPLSALAGSFYSDAEARPRPPERPRRTARAPAPGGSRVGHSDRRVRTSSQRTHGHRPVPPVVAPGATPAASAISRCGHPLLGRQGEPAPRSAAAAAADFGGGLGGEQSRTAISGSRRTDSRADPLPAAAPGVSSGYGALVMDGEGTVPGTALLIAAAPVGKARMVDAASVLPVLAAVSPGVLAGSATASVVELADPLDPQTVLTRLRAAAMTPGPLTVYLVGQLHLDRRQRLQHVALARTTAATVRYTGFPWHWIALELRLRPPGSTTVIADLHADNDSWQQLSRRPLDVGTGVALYGRIAPSPGRRAVAVPSYMKALATVLRSGHRPPLPDLHQHVAAQVLAEGATDIVLSADPAVAFLAGGPGGPGGPAGTRNQQQGGPTPAAPPSAAAPSSAAPRTAGADPHAAITKAVEAGRHGEAAAMAAAWEQEALRTYGPSSPEVVHWMEVRGHLAIFAKDPGRSCEIWLAVVSARITAGQAPDAPDVEAAADLAHHQWEQVRDPDTVRELGPALVALRRRVPGRQRGTVNLVQQRLVQFHTQVG